ncbi:MAG TPA: amidase [Vicinamibacterales bacterium]|nr:amidase [Vicinamibacterales bacterium]
MNGPAPTDDLCSRGAVDLADAVRRGSVTAEAAVAASLSRIEAVDDALKAFITVAAEQALASARAADEQRAQGRVLGPLHGVPVAIKDLTATAGIRTTFGAVRHRDHVPIESEVCVERLVKAGAIVLGKTNTPEFGFGAVCTNAMQGPTANPWNLALTSGGSSGGAAVAVTTGMVPLAHGTDFGGSVRTPASFCGCVGLRPTPGLIPDPSRKLAWNTLATHGILARSVEDAALMLAVMAGAHPKDPTSHAARGWKMPRPDRLGSRDPRSFRIASSPTLGDAFRIDPEVRAAFEAADGVTARHFETARRAHPDCREAVQAFKTLRAAHSWAGFRELLAVGEDDLGPSFVWNVKEGRSITAQDHLEAETARSRVYRVFADFFADHDILMLPAASVLPFPNAQGEVTSIDGVECETIIDYLAPTFIISLVGYPALSLPALWTDDGRPFGVQLVGRPYEEDALLGAARHLQEVAGFRHRWPERSG